MTKSDAQKVLDAGGVTAGHARGLVAAYAANPPDVSRLNPALSGAQAAAILGPVFEDRPDDYEAPIWVPDARSRKPRLTLSRDALILRNVLVECAPKGWTP